MFISLVRLPLPERDIHTATNNPMRRTHVTMMTTVSELVVDGSCITPVIVVPGKTVVTPEKVSALVV
jgi:hypothetical protein